MNLNLNGLQTVNANGTTNAPVYNTNMALKSEPVAPFLASAPTTPTIPVQSPVVTPPVMSPSNLTGTTQPLPITTPSTAAPADISNIDTTPPPTPVATPIQDSAQSLFNKIMGENTSAVGKSAYQAEQNTKFGIPDLTKTQNDLTANIVALQNQSKALQNEAQYTIPNQDQIDATGRGITKGGLAPKTASELRINQIKQGAIATQALTTASALAAVQGNLSTAQYYADQAVAQKYGPIEEQIKADTANLQLLINSPDYSKEEKAQAQSLLDAQDAKKAKIDLAKQDMQTITSWASAALANGASTVTSQQILAIATSSNPDLNKAFKLFAPYAVDPMATQKAVADLALTRAQTANANANANKTNAETKALGTTSTGTNSGIVNTILASGKFTKEQAATVANAINNGQDALTVVKNNAKNIMTGATATKLESYENSLSAIQDLDSALSAYYTAGGSTGLFKGNFEQVANKLGKVNDANLVTVATQVQIALQAYRNAISGTAYSDQEGKDIASVFPSIKNGKILNDSIVKGRVLSAQNLIDGIYKNTLGSAYDTLKNAGQSIPKGTDGASYGFPGYVSDGTQWVPK